MLNVVLLEGKVISPVVMGRCNLSILDSKFSHLYVYKGNGISSLWNNVMIL